jgi:hypothetical protein
LFFAGPFPSVAGKGRFCARYSAQPNARLTILAFDPLVKLGPMELLMPAVDAESVIHNGGLRPTKAAEATVEGGYRGRGKRRGC